jgi:5-formaminoimidazole-4-carboxamide-1-beta-D-ribofuranosyl 5'-monophosphate synthetase
MKRLTVTIPNTTFDKLKLLQEKMDKSSLSAAVTASISAFSWMNEAKEEGFEVKAEKEEGKYKIIKELAY